jgi:integrase
MATANLTKRSVDALKFSQGCDYFVWDQNLRGFGVRVTERELGDSGVLRRKVFVVGYRPRGSRQFRRLTLGTFGPMTVDKARAEALRQLAAVTSGADPVAARKAKRSESTVRELGASYLADVRLRRKPNTATEYDRMWRKHVLPALGSKKVASVTGADVRRLHRSMHKTPYLANRVVAMLGAFFTYGAKEGARATHDNPVRGVEAYAEEGRERFLTPDEYRRLGEALAKAEQEGLRVPPKIQQQSRGMSKVRRSKLTGRKRGPYKRTTPPSLRPASPLAVSAIRLLATTGCRENEILSLRWECVDFERGYLRLDDTKTGRSTRPLGATAAAILRSLPRFDDSNYVFPSADGRSHLSEIKRLWSAVRQSAKLDDLRLHDLRHSFASVSAIGGDSLLVVRSLLGHARVATTERYAHLSDDPVKRAADRTSGDISSWLRGSETPVSPLQQNSR